MDTRKPGVHLLGAQLWSGGLDRSLWVTPASTAAFLGAASMT